MIKHIGKHNNKKIVLLYREVPDEHHMCLVAYSDTLPRLVHDEVMSVLESAAGQSAPSLSDALFRSILPDGRNTLQALHRDGLIKKVPTNQVLITPNRTSTVRLDELNTILNEMAKGEEATKKLSEIDSQQGMAANSKVNRPARRGRDVGEPVVTETTTSTDSVLSDADLAKQRRQQAEAMKADAIRLLKEAESLMSEAAQLDSNVTTNNDKPTKKKAVKAKKD